MFGAMAAGTSRKLISFPNSAYAVELRRGESRRFNPEIEAEYVRNHLRSHITVIRVSSVLAVLFGVRHVGDLLFGQPPSLAHLLQVAVVLAISIVLASLTFGRALERFYLPAARLGVPIRNGIAAVAIPVMLKQGNFEALMLLPLMVVGPFFFLGLPLWNALVAVAVTIASFAVSAVVLELPAPLIIRCTVLLLMAACACALAARQLQKVSRRSFLEHGLIAELADHDSLTGLNNRRVFDEQLTELWQQAAAYGRTIAILLIDIDHFKAYNDHYGHQAGDHALRLVAQTLRRLVTRTLDVIVRYGGEEFAVILYDIDGLRAEKLAEHMRRAIADLALEHRGSRGYGKVTISIGIAIVDPTRERRPRGALQLADEALYEAKLHGRNCVRVRNQDAHSTLVTGVFSKGPQPKTGAGAATGAAGPHGFPSV